MKPVILSVRAEWCKLIGDRKKTIEVRKTKPKLELPFKVYIYCTKSEPLLKFNSRMWNGKIIGEFVCDKIINAKHIGGAEFTQESCMTLEDWITYSDKVKGNIWCWNISELKIYDQPKLLDEFGISRAPQDWCYTISK